LRRILQICIWGDSLSTVAAGCFLMSDSARVFHTPPADLSACDREPIHVPGSIQPHGMLLVLDAATLEVLQASVNVAELTGGKPFLGRPLQDVLPAIGDRMLDAIRGLPGPDQDDGHYLGPLDIGDGKTGAAFHAVGWRQADTLVLELERRGKGRTGSFEDVYPLIRAFVEELRGAETVGALCRLAAKEVRRITGFDRVLVYRFDPHWNGTVVAEDRNDVLPSYLDLRFPASDIPAQARELYRRNRVRLIADADYRPVPIEPAVNPRTGRPLDLTAANLRSVSPVHLEYMRNMGTGASMSFSVMCEGRLWGLISCHNREPRRAPFHVRAACDHIARVFSLQVVAKEREADVGHRMELRAVQIKLLGHMAEEEHFLQGLTRNADDLLSLTNAQGAAIIFGGGVTLLGRTPPEEQVRALAAWLGRRGVEDVFVTDRLAAEMPDGAALKETASGILAIGISQINPDYLIWFRPEVTQTVKWGGDPHKPVDIPPDARIHPRRSFETWKETVSLVSRPWTPGERTAAEELRTAIVNVVLRKAEELAAVSEELKRSNKELEAFSYSVSHDLRAPFRHIVGYAQLLREREGDKLSDRGRHYLESITEAAVAAGTLVDNLLSFAQMGRVALTVSDVPMNLLVQEVVRRFDLDTAGRRIEWRIGDLGSVRGDPNMLRLVLENLIGNAIKFTRGRNPAVIDIGCERRRHEVEFHVRDNGAGFDMAYVGKLFGVFQRLHHTEDFEGTGIGLANVRRIVERHGGRTWAEGAEGVGATFHFTLPLKAGVS